MDNVNHPDHYKGQKYECIEVMREVFGEEAVKHFCRLNAFKYLWRADKKNGEEDIQKAKWYLNELTKEGDMLEPDEKEYNVVFGYVDHNGKFHNMEFTGSFEATIEPESDMDENNPGKDVFETMAMEIHSLYAALLKAGFEKNHAYGLTRDLFRGAMRGKHDNAAED